MLDVDSFALGVLLASLFFMLLVRSVARSADRVIDKQNVLIAMQREWIASLEAKVERLNGRQTTEG